MPSKVQKISIALPKEMVEDLRYAVESGDYASVSEVVREAVREWKGPGRELPERVRVPKTREEFRARLARAQKSLDEGKGIPAEELFAELRARFGVPKRRKPRRR
jgi:antitoxin ParD1/3/4